MKRKRTKKNAKDVCRTLCTSDAPVHEYREKALNMFLQNNMNRFVIMNNQDRLMLFLVLSDQFDIEFRYPASILLACQTVLQSHIQFDFTGILAIVMVMAKIWSDFSATNTSIANYFKTNLRTLNNIEKAMVTRCKLLDLNCVIYCET